MPRSVSKTFVLPAAAMARASPCDLDNVFRFRICVGASAAVRVPSPSCSSLFAPQQRTVPSFLSAHECEEPAATMATPDERYITLWGVSWGSPLNPKPSCPDSFFPQQDTAPSPDEAHVCCAPVA